MSTTKKPQTVDKKVIGLTIEKAQKYWDDIRAVKIDGEYTVVTRDYRPLRMNVEIVNGKITSIHNFG